MPALGIEQRPPPPPRGHAARLRASVRRNLSQFELDDVDMEDAAGDIEEDVLDAKIVEVEAGLGAAQQEGLQPLEGLVGVAQEAHSYEAYDGVITIMINL